VQRPGLITTTPHRAGTDTGPQEHTMTAKTTTVRVYPADAQRLDKVRKALQRVTGDDMTIADAVSASLDAWEVLPPSAR